MDLEGIFDSLTISVVLHPIEWVLIPAPLDLLGFSVGFAFQLLALLVGFYLLACLQFQVKMLFLNHQVTLNGGA